MVGAAPAGLSGTGDVRRLLDVGGVSRDVLLQGAVSLALLFAVALRRAARMVWGEAALVSRLAAVVGGAVDLVGARRISLHLLLLPRRVLQSLLGRSALMRRRRASKILLGREQVPPDLSEHPPVLHVSGAALSRVPRLRRLGGAVVSRRQREK